jgi:hypothetical protein
VICNKCNAARQMHAQAALTHGIISGESYSFTMTDPDQEIVWSLDVARGYIRAGLVPIMELDPDALKSWIDTYADVDEAHLDHIPLESIYVPGILIAIATAPTVDDPIEIFPILLDGTHRATRALREGRPFFAYVLNEPQQRDCRVQYWLNGRLIAQTEPIPGGWPDIREARILAAHQQVRVVPVQ